MDQRATAITRCDAAEADLPRTSLSELRRIQTSLLVWAGAPTRLDVARIRPTAALCAAHPIARQTSTRFSDLPRRCNHHAISLNHENQSCRIELGSQANGFGVVINKHGPETGFLRPLAGSIKRDANKKPFAIEFRRFLWGKSSQQRWWYRRFGSGCRE